MKKLLLAAVIAVTAAGSTSAYYIGGEYASLVSCDYGQWGYEWGNIGTYKTTSGDYYRIFFGSSWCQY